MKLMGDNVLVGLGLIVLPTALVSSFPLSLTVHEADQQSEQSEFFTDGIKSNTPREVRFFLTEKH